MEKLYLFFVYSTWLFFTSVGLAQDFQTEEARTMMRVVKENKENYTKDLLRLYELHKQKYDRKTIIITFEHLIRKFSPTHEADAIAKLCEFLSFEYMAEIAKDKNYIQYADKFFVEIAQKLKNACEAGEIYTILGVLYTHEKVKDYTTAKEYFEKDLQIAQKSPCTHKSRNAVYPYATISKHIYEKIGDYAKAHAYYLRAVHLTDSLQLDFEQRAYYADKLGRLYYKTENYKEAYQMWEKALAYLQRTQIHNRDLIQAFNNLGLVKRKKQELQEATNWFEKAFQEAVYQKDNVWQGIISGNLGYTAYLQKNYPKAIELLEKDIAICSAHKEFNNVVSSLIYLGGAYQAQKDYKKALETYQKVLAYLKDEHNAVVFYEPQADLRVYRDVYKGLADIWHIFKDHEQAYQCLALHKKYNDTLLFLQNKENLALQQARQDFDTKNKEKENALKQQRFFTTSLVVLLLLVVGMSLLTFRNYRLIANKKKLEAENLALAHEAEMERNQRLQEAMVIKEQQMAISALQMQQKNEMLLELKKEIVVSDASSKKLEKIVDYTLDLDSDWEEFKQHFEQIHPLFFHKLQQMSDKITPNDLKHCAYIRINLDMKQIAHIMRIAPESVKMSRTRLRKKLNITPDVDLHRFLSNL